MNDDQISVLNINDLSIIKQWFNAVQDINPIYLNEDDFNLMSKLETIIQLQEPAAHPPNSNTTSS